MEIKHSSPRSLGVEKLIYIGDDEIGKPSSHKTAKVILATMGAGLLFSFFGKTKATKTLGTVLVFGPLALELYYHANGSCTYDLP